MVPDANNDADAACSDLNVKCFEEVTTSEEVIRHSDPYIDLENLKNKHVKIFKKKLRKGQGVRGVLFYGRGLDIFELLHHLFMKFL